MLKEIWSYIKGKISYWRKTPKTEEEKTLFRLDLIVTACVAFLIVYGSYYFVYMERVISHAPPVIPTYRISTNQVNPILIGKGFQSTSAFSTNVTNDIFEVGEVVGIKNFGKVGIIHEKVFGVQGYTYIIRRLDHCDTFQDIECRPEELYRPDKNAMNLIFLQD